MIDLAALEDIVQPTSSRIVMLVIDGLGGAPHLGTGRSELEEARLPNLDRLAKEGSVGRTLPILPGVTPGSGPGHLALFGYDPLRYFIGRGVLEALGIGAEISQGDIASRGNFCTLDSNGLLVDRRAGRISSDESRPLCDKLDSIQVDGVDLSVFHVQDYRFVLRMNGEGLSDQLTETDPQRNGAEPLAVSGLNPEAIRTACLVNDFVDQARVLLGGRDRANMILLRGFSTFPTLPSIRDSYKLKPAAIAAYPMYRGLASVMGMDVIPTGGTFDHELDTLEQHYNDYDFFYIHYKPADAKGEDGDFQAKVRALEELDAYIPRLVALDPDVLVVAGDHATPAILGSHSWHPVPVLLRSKVTRGDGVGAFDERACATGSLGTFSAMHLMLLVLAHAGKLRKYGP